MCADPELRFAPSGAACCNGRLAINARRRDEPALFLSFSIFGKGAEALAKFAAKGSCVMLDGRLEANNYTTKSGEKRESIRLIATEWTFGESKAKEPCAVDGETAPATDDGEELPF